MAQDRPTALVTGSASGIGPGAALRLARAGDGADGRDQVRRGRRGVGFQSELARTT